MPGVSCHRGIGYSLPSGERWAWYPTWILVIGFAAPVRINLEIYVMAYLIAAGIMAFALLLTRFLF